MTRPVTRVMLALSGLIGLYIGLSILLEPQSFFAHNGVEISADIGLMSEIKAPAMVLLVTALVVLICSVKSRFATMGLLLGGLVYGSYGIGRLVSMVLDGVPPDALVIATAIELAFAAILIFLAVRSSRTENGG